MLVAYLRGAAKLAAVTFYLPSRNGLCICFPEASALEDGHSPFLNDHWLPFHFDGFNLKVVLLGSMGGIRALELGMPLFMMVNWPVWLQRRTLGALGAPWGNRPFALCLRGHKLFFRVRFGVSFLGVVIALIGEMG
eukprot:1161869-Pelagomonas_calceolata.AAC.2